MKDIVIAKSGDGDWAGIYVDGVLYKEDHSLTPYDVLNILGISYRGVTLSNERIECEGGRFPTSLQDLEEIIDDEMNCNL
jgi:hypothetical protein